MTALPKTTGGEFLIESRASEEIFTPEDFTDDHLAVARATDEFWNAEVAPRLEAIHRLEPGVAELVLRKSAEAGLTAATVPERYGGMELDLISAVIIAERLGRDGSYAAWHGAHSGIGTMPLLLFGTEEQKQRYLPRLARAEIIGAYCLSEPHAGSDALAIRTRAELNAAGTHYILNGQKMWITNGGAAGLFTVFAKVDGEKFTAFLVERSFPGVSTGAEEKKMGIKGSSTTALYLDNVKVPVENVLGEIGRGHIIAFNILNLGRLKLGPFAVGAAKEVLAASLRYAKDRVAFGKPISEFGLIRHKLAEMAVRIFAAESMSYRVGGMIEALLADFSWDRPDAAATMMKAVAEFAAECSFVKIFASEALDYVTDEGVQIHGGYGYHQDYMVERAYRDSRINRIFEGTNEINRLLAAGMLLKRAQRGQLALVEAVKKLESEILSGPPALEPDGEPLAGEGRMVSNAKRIVLLALGAAYRKYLAALEEQQEVLAGITDMAMNVLAMESVRLRALKLAARGRGDLASDFCAVFCRNAMEQVESTAKTLLAACAEGDALRGHLAVLRRFTKFEPADGIGLRRRIAGRLLEAERYVVQ